MSNKDKLKQIRESLSESLQRIGDLIGQEKAHSDNDHLLRLSKKEIEVVYNRLKYIKF